MSRLDFTWKTTAVRGRGFIAGLAGFACLGDIRLCEMSVKQVGPRVWDSKVDGVHIAFSLTCDEAMVAAEAHARMLADAIPGAPGG